MADEFGRKAQFRRSVGRGGGVQLAAAHVLLQVDLNELHRHFLPLSGPASSRQPQKTRQLAIWQKTP